jgi:hypothetical protein
MKQLQVPYLFIKIKTIEFLQVSKLLDCQKPENIEVLPWPLYNSQPDASFAIAHNGQTIFLKYYVTEKETKTVYTEINDPVYRDSCVEFFISFNNGLAYYNLEFNSKGVCLAGYGSGRENRKLLPAAVISKIECLPYSSPLYDSQSNYWELCLAIPVSVFCFDELSDLNGRSFKANFYKCGDDLTEPHFLVWNKIISKEPDFHIPEYFGELTFASTSVLI